MFGRARLELFGGGPADFGQQFRALDDFRRRIRDLGAGADVFVIANTWRLRRRRFPPTRCVPRRPAGGPPAASGDAPVEEAALADDSDIHYGHQPVYTPPATARGWREGGWTSRCRMARMKRNPKA